MTSEPNSEKAHWNSTAMSTPETTAELCERLNMGIKGGLQMYGAVHTNMFAEPYFVCVLPQGPTPAGPQFVERHHDELSGGGVYSTFIRRTIPDVGIHGVATVKSDDTIKVDYTITGTLPDGYPLHLNHDATLTIRDGKVTHYLIKHDPEEMQRYLVALGNPYSGGKIEAFEVRS